MNRKFPAGRLVIFGLDNETKSCQAYYLALGSLRESRGAIGVRSLAPSWPDAALLKTPGLETWYYEHTWLKDQIPLLASKRWDEAVLFVDVSERGRLIEGLFSEEYQITGKTDFLAGNGVAIAAIEGRRSQGAPEAVH